MCSYIRCAPHQKAWRRAIKRGDIYCNYLLPKGQDSKILKSLAQFNYATLYATCSTSEDFAETMSEYILLNELGMNYQISKNEKIVFNQAKHLAHPNMRSKIQTIKTILSYDDLVKTGLDLVVCKWGFKID